MPMPTKEAILAFLESLGSTADEVYESLKARNVKGRRRGRECPIEVVLNQEFGDDVNFSVGISSVSVSVQPASRPGAWMPGFDMPEPIWRFIDAFDAKNYPDVDLSPVPPAEGE